MPRGGRAKVEYVLAVLEQSARAVNEKVRKHEDDAEPHDELRDGDGGAHVALGARAVGAADLRAARAHPDRQGAAAANPETMAPSFPVSRKPKAEPPKRNGPRSGKLYLFSDALLLAAGLPENGPATAAAMSAPAS